MRNFTGFSLDPVNFVSKSAFRSRLRPIVRRGKRQPSAQIEGRLGRDHVGSWERSGRISDAEFDDILILKHVIPFYGGAIVNLSPPDPSRLEVFRDVSVD